MLPVLLASPLAWFGALSTPKKVVIGLAVTVFLIEVALRTIARKSKLYARWTRGFEGIGEVWSAVILSLIYVLSVGPVSLFMLLLGKDPLDRRIQTEPSAWRPHEPNPLGPQAAARHQF